VCRSWSCCAALVLALGNVEAAEPRDAAVQHIWEAAYLRQTRAGYVHTTVNEFTRQGQKIVKATVDLSLTVKRFNDTVNLRMETGTEEAADGKVLAVSMRQFLGKDQQLIMRGTVEGEQLHVKVDGGRRLDKRIRWTDEVVGLYRQRRLFREHQVKPGDRFRYSSYEPTVTAVVVTRVTVKDYEEVEMPATRKKLRLLRVEAIPDKIDDFQLPGTTYWLDDDRMPVRSQTDVPGLGLVTLVATTEESARRPGIASAVLPDMGTGNLIAIRSPIRQPYDAEAAIYRITVKGEDSPGTAFAQDDRQQIKNVRGRSLELHVHARRDPTPSLPAKNVGPEFLKSCYYINCDDAKVRDHARQAIGQETDPWRQAQRIETWVHLHMRRDNGSDAFATADHVARTLRGDCTEYAMLAAAMCRAVGIPSRAAVGLVYVNSGGAPAFGFHMWAEVWVCGQWMPIDATLGKGYVGATHLKIADHSWCDTQSLTPILPALRVVGKTTIEVIQVKGRE
jgi:transglutaminase-like putative cysteine protease